VVDATVPVIAVSCHGLSLRGEFLKRRLISSASEVAVPAGMR
jgi:hypothetical protein